MNHTKSNEAKPRKHTENILKTISYTENKPKDTIQKGINKKGHKWF